MSDNRSAPPFAVLIGCACAISLITFGVRSVFGLFIDPVVHSDGWSREVFALAIAIQNLFWGLGQPFAGMLVDRFGPIRVLAVGGILYAAGTASMAMTTTPLGLHLGIGVLVGLGMSGASFVTVLGALGRLVPEDRRSWALGVGTAAGSLGQFVFAPLGQSFIDAYGWQQATLILAGFVALVPLLATGVRGRLETPPTPEAEPVLPIAECLRYAFGHGSYLLLLIGFFVCGFQLAFIYVHLPPYLSDLHMDPTLASWAIGIIGLANIVGAYGAGVLGNRCSKRGLLSIIYFGRVAAIAAFILLPATAATVVVFAMIMGLLWLSTVPLTSGLVAVMFGTRYMGMLFGFVFFSHQLGSFLGAWLGGALYAATGSYEVVWWITIALGMGAGVIHWPIVEARAPRFAPAAT